MRREQLIERIRGTGVTPVTLSSFGDNSSGSPFWDFEGSFDEFLQVAQELESRAVFLIAYEFDESDFVAVHPITKMTTTAPAMKKSPLI